MRRLRRWFLVVVAAAAAAVLVAVYLGLDPLVRWATGEQALEEPSYSLIEDGLYMGGDVREPPPGVRAVVNLCEKKDSYQAEMHDWEPIRDAEPAPDLKWLKRMVELVDSRRRAGVPTLVHCRNGVSRSGMVVVAYEMAAKKWTRDEALAFVRTKRPQVRPNPAFMKLLEDWERELGAPAGGGD
jgi:hypothetical protein